MHVKELLAGSGSQIYKWPLPSFQALLSDARVCKNITNNMKLNICASVWERINTWKIAKCATGHFLSPVEEYVMLSQMPQETQRILQTGPENLRKNFTCATTCFS